MNGVRIRIPLSDYLKLDGSRLSNGCLIYHKHLMKDVTFIQQIDSEHGDQLIRWSMDNIEHLPLTINDFEILEEVVLQSCVRNIVISAYNNSAFAGNAMARVLHPEVKYLTLEDFLKKHKLD